MSDLCPLVLSLGKLVMALTKGLWQKCGHVTSEAEVQKATQFLACLLEYPDLSYEKSNHREAAIL